MQQIAQKVFARGIGVEEDRPGMMESPSRIIPIQLVKQLRFSNFQGISREVASSECAWKKKKLKWDAMKITANVIQSKKNLRLSVIYRSRFRIRVR